MDNRPAHSGLTKSSVAKSRLAKSVAAAAALIGAICAARPAEAGPVTFGVRTLTTAFAAGEDLLNPGVSLAGQASADYNASSYTGGAHFTTSGTGAATGGTSDTSGRLTSAFDQSGVIAGPTSQAYAAADLATGSVHVWATGNNACKGFCGPNSIVTGTAGTALASFFDRLHFTVAGAGANTVTPITVTFNIDGFFSEGFVGRGTESASFHFDDLADVHRHSSVQFDTGVPPNTGGGVDVITNSQFSGWASGQWLTLSTTLAQFQGVFDLVGASDDVLTSLQVGLTCVDDIVCNFKNTGSVDMVLPGNVSFTSASGVFLTNAAGPGGPPTNVPEPSSLLVFGSGLAWLAAGRRNRQARRRTGLPQPVH
jgi:hypothetical protein